MPVGSQNMRNMPLWQWVSTGGDFCAPGDIWQCLETFLSVTTGEKCYWHVVGRGWVEATTHRTASHNKVPGPKCAWLLGDAVLRWHAFPNFKGLYSYFLHNFMWNCFSKASSFHYRSHGTIYSNLTWYNQTFLDSGIMISKRNVYQVKKKVLLI